MKITEGPAPKPKKAKALPKLTPYDLGGYPEVRTLGSGVGAGSRRPEITTGTNYLGFGNVGTVPTSVSIPGYGGTGYTAPPTAGGGGGNGGGGMPGTLPGWSEFGYRPENAPDWWKALKPPEMDDRSSWLAQLNLMIPYLSPEDQRQATNILYREDPTNFAHLAPELTQFAGIPDELLKGERQEWLGGARAGGIMEALDKLKEVMGKSSAEMGTGYNWMRQVGQLTKDYGATGERAPTRADFSKLMSAWNPLQEQAPEGYGLMGRMSLLPFFSTGKLMETQSRMDQSTYYGKPSKKLFF